MCPPAADADSTRAADRGVKMRIYLDGTQLAERDPSEDFNELAETPGVEIKTKHKPAAPMHLKTKSTGCCCAPAPQTFPHPASSGRTMIWSLSRAPKPRWLFKHAFDARFGSGELLP
jgi:hypothetical protein